MKKYAHFRTKALPRKILKADYNMKYLIISLHLIPMNTSTKQDNSSFINKSDDMAAHRSCATCT